MPNITKVLAQRIAGKLQAATAPGRSHDLAVIYHEGKKIAQFGIMRGSRNDASHNWIPGQIFTSPKQAYLLGKCTWKLKEWVALMREKGKL